MNKQKEIKEGMQRLRPTGICSKDEWFFLVDVIFKYLHSQGAVIKVDDNSYVAPCLRDSWEEIKQDMKEAGYEAVEPIIEESNGE